MTNQQVNFFQPTFRKQRKLLSFWTMLQTCLAVIIVMVGMYGGGEWQSWKIQENLQVLKKQFHLKTSQLTNAGSGSSNNNVNLLKQELIGLERKLVEQRNMVVELKEVRDNFGGGVSEYMSSFSRQSPKGVWLTGFSVRAGGEELIIYGSSLKPDLIPVFLQNLSSEPSLSGTRFGLLEIEREQSVGQYVDFTVFTGSEIPHEDFK